MEGKTPYYEHEVAEGIFFTDDGRPWNLNRMPFFKPIYNINSPKILLKTSRQSTKSTLQRNKLTLRSIYNKGNSALFVAPTGRQIRDFSRKKLDTVFAFNPDLKSKYVSASDAWNVHFKQFNTGSTITLASTGGYQGAEAIRGSVANDIFIDEYQSMLDEHIPVILECAATFDGRDGRPTAYYINTGTPLSYANPIEYEWNLSTGFEWIMKCPHCGNWQAPLGMEHIDVSIPYLFCTHCKRNMNRVTGTPKKFDAPEFDISLLRNPYGEWWPTNPKAKFPGYRIVRLMMPWARWRTPNGDGILDRLETWPERRFVNEIMGMPFAGGDNPLTEADIKAICLPGEKLPRTVAEEVLVASRYASDVKVAGLDWAMNSSDATPSYTNMGIYAIHQGKMRLIYAHKFVGAGSSDPDHILRFIGEKMNTFGVSLLAADYGVGYFEDQRLKRMFPNRVATIHYSGASGRVRTTYDTVGDKYMVPRTASLDELVSAIKHHEIELPEYDDCKEFVSDWLRITIEISESTRTILFRRSGTDDFFHVTNYAHIARRMVGGRANYYEADDNYGVSTPLG